MRDCRIDAVNDDRARIPICSGRVIEENRQLSVDGRGFHGSLHFLSRRHAEYIAVFDAIQFDPHRTVTHLVVLDPYGYLVRTIRDVQFNVISAILRPISVGCIEQTEPLITGKDRTRGEIVADNFTPRLQNILRAYLLQSSEAALQFHELIFPASTHVSSGAHHQVGAIDVPRRLNNALPRLDRTLLMADCVIQCIQVVGLLIKRHAQAGRNAMSMIRS